MTNKLILGTAQFGSNYGIKHDGQPSEKEIEKIARVAWDGGIRFIHTSWLYRLSKTCETIFSEFGWIIKHESRSGYFNFINRLGYSAYNISEIPSHPDLEIIQLPVNVLTPNLENIRKLKATNFEIHARSVFLQGLLLMEELPKWISVEAESMIRAFHLTCNKEGLQYYEAALGWVLGLEEIDKVIVGVNSAKQLEELLSVKPLKWDYDFSITDENVLDPRRWPK